MGNPTSIPVWVSVKMTWIERIIIFVFSGLKRVSEICSVCVCLGCIDISSEILCFRCNLTRLFVIQRRFGNVLVVCFLTAFWVILASVWKASNSNMFKPKEEQLLGVVLICDFLSVRAEISMMWSPENVSYCFSVCISPGERLPALLIHWVQENGSILSCSIWLLKS